MTVSTRSGLTILDASGIAKKTKPFVKEVHQQQIQLPRLPYHAPAAYLHDDVRIETRHY